jgi:hypothetical protein
MLKIRCENCSRLIVGAPIKEEGRHFCVDGCRENWKRAMRRFRVEQKPLTVGDP